MAWLTEVERGRSEYLQRCADPLIKKLELSLSGLQAISTVALLDLVDLPATTGNARRVATSMRALGFVPLKSRRLAPGGFRGTTIRGWARAVRGDVRRNWALPGRSDLAPSP